MKNTKSSDLTIIGGGISTLFFLANIDENYHISVFEKSTKPNAIGKRILVSGNGRCNFFNQNLLNEEFFCEYPFDKFKDILQDDKGDFLLAKQLLNILDKLSFPYVVEKGYYYPFFNRSESLYNLLLSIVSKKKNIEFIFEEVSKVDRKDKVISTISGNRYPFDKLIIATGGRSYDRDDFTYSLLDSLDVIYTPFKPSLCPIKVKETLPKYLVNNRLRGKVSLIKNSKTIHEEYGEVLFKKDALSGIVTFNMSMYLNLLDSFDNTQIEIDFSYPCFNTLRKEKPIKYNQECLPLFLKRYLLENNIKDSKLTFNVSSLYDFKDSQVSFGGIDINELNLKSLSLKNDHDVFFLGEVINTPLPCGGYNIGLTLIESYKLAKHFNYAKK